MFFVTLFLMKPTFTSAQVSVTFNIDSQPLWGPTTYDYVEYYFMPELGIYYYAPKAQFVYMKDNRWQFSSRLPYQYRNIDLYSTYKVVINEPKPYLRNDHYSDYYKQYRHEHFKQDNIRDSHDSKYAIRKDHPNNSHNNAITPQREKAHPISNKSGNNNSSEKKDHKQGRR